MVLKKKKATILLVLALVLAFASAYAVYAWTALPVVDDPLVRMPGTQPGQVSLEAPGRCLNCHAGYNQAVEPGFNWKGSMMAQSARDFLFWSCLTVAGQDTIWAVGNPNAVDICERCHFPKGWLEGRSDPTNVSAMAGADYDGVQCDFCHTMWDPFFEDTYSGVREGDDWLNYWDETNASSTPSDQAALATYQEDAALAAGIVQYNGLSFFTGNQPPAAYDENGSGQYFISPNSDKRASFADAAARHRMLYSRYHKSKYFCNTCHDVSNPVLANLGADAAAQLPTESNPAYSYFHVERTFSEFMLSAYGQQGGAPTNPEFQAQGAPGITQAAKCQDCHMRDVQGVACNKQGVLERPLESIEHPDSGQPLHDMTGGNVWVSTVLASAVPGSPNYNATNDALLNQGPAVLTLDLSQGEGIDPAALLAGAERARQQLLLAATIKEVNYASGELTFQVQNNTGHKLISGFPEGRRMFVNIKAYAGGTQVYEVNPYDSGAGTLKGLEKDGLPYPYGESGLRAPCDLGFEYDPSASACVPLAYPEVYVDELVYEMHPTSSEDVPDAGGKGLTGETETFHFALATGRYKDNRIPPKGFDLANADARLSLPVWHGVAEDPAEPWIYTGAEYANGYDQVALTIPAGVDAVEIRLFYQTTSREYIEFLRDEIRGTASTLTGTGAGGDPAYNVQSDPFFSQLKGWGDTIWSLWTHNMNLEGAKPFLMTSATFGAPPAGCSAPAPTLLSTTAGDKQVTVTWGDESGDPEVVGYRVYYDQSGKAQLVSEVADPQVTSYTDTGLTNGVEYCYNVTSYKAGCESGFSGILCATPKGTGQTPNLVGVDTLQTGVYTGKGKNQSFSLQSAFSAGSQVVLRAHVVDAGGNPLSGAVVGIKIEGPEVVLLSSGPSDADGYAEAVWQTSAPNPKGRGGTTPGTYSATVTNVTLDGYSWDGVMTTTGLSIQ